jgi:hypothetical protein
MKLLLVLSGICVALLSMGTRAEAQNYPWCAYYSSRRRRRRDKLRFHHI